MFFVGFVFLDDGWYDMDYVAIVFYDEHFVA